MENWGTAPLVSPSEVLPHPDLGDPIWRGMVCVETGNVADNEVRLAAGGEHQMSTAISVDAGQ